MKRRKFISFLAGFLTAIPFCGLLFSKSEPVLDLATFKKIQKQMNKTRIQEVTIDGKKYRAIGIIDDELVKRIEKYRKYYMIGESGIVK